MTKKIVIYANDFQTLSNAITLLCLDFQLSILQKARSCIKSGENVTQQNACLLHLIKTRKSFGHEKPLQ